MQARFEVSGVAGGDGHLRGLSDGRNECGIERSVLRDSVGGQESRGGQVERKHPPGERCKHPVFEPPAQDRTLGWVGSFLAKTPRSISAMVVAATKRSAMGTDAALASTCG